MCRLVNTSTHRCDVYIGRGSPWGNPFKTGVHGTRTQVIEKFSTYFLNRINEDDVFKANTLQLQGKVLGCHCKPLTCHGDVIVDYIHSQNFLSAFSNL